MRRLSRLGAIGAVALLAAVLSFGLTTPSPEVEATRKATTTQTEDKPLLFVLEELAAAGDPQAIPVARSYLAIAGRDEALKHAVAAWNGFDGTERPAVAVAIYHALWDTRREHSAGFQLGLAYFLGRGVAADPVKALGYFDSPEIRDNRAALYYRARILFETSAAPHRRKEAQLLLDRSAQMGYEPAQDYLPPR